MTDIKVDVDGAAMSITPIQFFNVIQDKNLTTLSEFGGIEAVAKNLGADLEKGIASTTVERRQDVYGVNYLPPEEEVTYLRYLLEALSDKMMILLLVLGAVALIINLSVPESGNDSVHYSTAWIDGTFIIVAVTIVILVTTINDYLKGLKFAKLNELTSKVPVKVLRDGQRVEVDIADLLVGDIVEFGEGSYLPADGLFLQGQGVAIDESAATGENDEKKKDAIKDPFLLSGTNVLTGHDAKMLVIGVGENSFSGKIELNAREHGKKTSTPLQEKLDVLADQVGTIGIAVALLLFVTLIVVTAVVAAENDESYEYKNILDFAIIGVSIIVVAVPEGLPLSVVIALAYSMSAMMDDNNMVRSLAACETMGAATSICSDKTGTLTTNEMTQIKANIGGLITNQYDHNGSASLTREEVHKDLSPAALAMYTEAIAYNSDAYTIPTPPGHQGKEYDGKIWLGNKTEQGLLRWVERADARGMEGIRALVPKADKMAYPFQSKKKTMTTLARMDHPSFGKSTVQYTKGAAEIVVQYCTEIMDADGKVHPLTEANKKQIVAGITEWGSTGLRCLSIACKKFGDYNATFPEEDPPTEGLIFLGFSGIEDPVRTEVPDAVAACQSARVTVRMCTGDNINTAKAIGKKCGLFTEGGLAMEGPAFRRLFCDDEAKFMEQLPRLQVLARCSPLDKQLLVGNLMLLGEVVAVTGDGTNDAPALKLADVGFAMNDGTDVAKKASKIILLDNNFVSVVKAVKWGRNVNDNIRKFLQFQFTVNVVLLVITFVGAVKDAASSGDGKPPLAAIHLLWANLIMDTMAALALSTENPNEFLLTRPPTYRDAPLISRKMKRFIVGCSFLQLIIMLVLIFKGEDLPAYATPSTTPIFSQWPYEIDPMPPAESDGQDWTPKSYDDEKEHRDMTLRTTIFNTFIFMQIFNWFWARKLYDEKNPFEGFGRSTFFLPIVAFTAGFQAFMVEVAQSFMETTSQNGARWAAALLLGFLMLPWGFVLRFIPVEEAPHVQKRLDHQLAQQKEEAEESDDESDDDEYGANVKLKLVMDVRKAQKALFSESKGKATEQGPVPVRPPAEEKASRLHEAVERVQSKQRVIRALRGVRGDSMRRKTSSNLTGTMNRTSSRSGQQMREMTDEQPRQQSNAPQGTASI